MTTCGGCSTHDGPWPGWQCVDCRVDTDALDEYYMVHDELWEAAGVPRDGGMLCVGCLEARLGRRLEARDFTGAPVNDPGEYHMSPRLLSRLGYHGPPT